MDIDITTSLFFLSFHPFLSGRGVIATQLAFTFGTVIPKLYQCVVWALNYFKQIMNSKACCAN